MADPNTEYANKLYKEIANTVYELTYRGERVNVIFRNPQNLIEFRDILAVLPYNKSYSDEAVVKTTFDAIMKARLSDQVKIDEIIYAGLNRKEVEIEYIDRVSIKADAFKDAIDTFSATFAAINRRAWDETMEAGGALQAVYREEKQKLIDKGQDPDPLIQKFNKVIEGINDVLTVYDAQMEFNRQAGGELKTFLESLED